MGGVGQFIAQVGMVSVCAWLQLKHHQAVQALLELWAP